MNIPENILGTLTDEQKKKVEAAQTPEELLAIAKETGHELSQEQLESVAAGKDWDKCTKYCESWGWCHVLCRSWQSCAQDCEKFDPNV